MEESVVNFDISKLSLEDLIKVYENINTFLKYLNDNKIEQEVDSDE